MLCPRCAVPLFDEAWSGSNVGHCPKCRGLWVPQRVLVSYIEHRSHSVIDGPRKVGDVGPVDACPSCTKPMKHVGYLGGDRVFVDRCDTCHALWLDADELEAIVVLNRRGAAPHATATPAPAARIAGMGPGSGSARQDGEICPRCGVATTRVPFRGVYVSVCGTCGGSLIPQQSLVQILESLVPSVGGAFDDALPPAVPDPGPIGSCPRCGGATESFGYMGMDRVTVDRCRPCNVMWADGAELLVMAALQARATRRSPAGRVQDALTARPYHVLDHVFVARTLLGR